MTVYNDKWASGQASSVIAAISSLPASTQAVLFLLADQPLISTALINNIITAYRAIGASLVAPYFHNRRGNPVLFDLAKWRSALLNLTGDTGAREILQANTYAIHRLELADDEVFVDVDTPAKF